LYNQNVKTETIKLAWFYYYGMKLTRYVIAAAAVPIVLLLIHGPQAQAYWGDGFGNGWNGNGWNGNGWNGNGWNGLGGGGYRYESGYQAGISDAIYDHDNNLAYNPIGQCLSCHSELYWHGFHQGYDHQWNSYQTQESTQGTSININGNNNYVSTNQYSGQNQDQQGPGPNPNPNPNSDFNPPVGSGPTSDNTNRRSDELKW
jgi:hypothetical protein